MITVQEVDRIIQQSVLAIEDEIIPLKSAVGRILKQEVKADRDFPPFDRVMMDGIAINYKNWQQGQREFKIEGLSAAGMAQLELHEQANCLEVMTGTVMPSKADAVIKYEEIRIDHDVAIIDDNHIVKEGQHIHRQGADRKAGTHLLAANKIISPAEIGVMATVGLSKVKVAQIPKIAVISTGDELVDVDESPAAHQIRKSNVHTLIGALSQHHFVAETFHFSDDEASLRRGLKGIIDFFDVVVLSGGVSKGKLDFIPGILQEVGVEQLFHFVKQRPGKPFWFGRHKKGVVFALPGNPVSSFVGLTRYVLPFLYRSAGVDVPPMKASLSEDFSFKPELTYFLQVKLQFAADGRLMATPAPGQGSGDLANLTEADAFLELPATIEHFKAGEVYDCYKFR